MDDDLTGEAARVAAAADRSIDVATIMIDQRLQAHCVHLLDTWLMPQIDEALRAA